MHPVGAPVCRVIAGENLPGIYQYRVVLRSQAPDDVISAREVAREPRAEWLL